MSDVVFASLYTAHEGKGTTYLVVREAEAQASLPKALNSLAWKRRGGDQLPGIDATILVGPTYLVAKADEVLNWTVRCPDTVFGPRVRDRATKPCAVEIPVTMFK